MVKNILNQLADKKKEKEDAILYAYAQFYKDLSAELSHAIEISHREGHGSITAPANILRKLYYTHPQETKEESKKMSGVPLFMSGGSLYKHFADDISRKFANKGWRFTVESRGASRFFTLRYL